jgi:tetratricopeptide (TPR) repeat protein
VAGLALLAHWVRLLQARPRRQAPRRWLLPALALAPGLATGYAVYRSTESIYLALIAAWLVFELFYPQLAGLLAASYKWEQVVYRILPRLLLAPLLLAAAMFLFDDLDRAVVAALVGLVAVEWVWRRGLARSNPILNLKMQVASAQLWGDAALVRQRSYHLRLAVLQHFKHMLEQADRQRAEGAAGPAVQRYTTIISGLEAVEHKTAEEQDVLGRSYGGLGKLGWRSNQRRALEDFARAKRYGFVDDEVRRLVAPVWAKQKRTDDEAIETYLRYLAARPDLKSLPDDTVVLACLEELCRIDEGMRGRALTLAMQNNQRVLQANGSIDWVHYYLGLGFLNQKKPQKAIEHLTRALELKRDRKDVFYHIGRAHVLRNQPQQAIAMLRQARQAMPEHGATAFLLGKLLLEGRLAEPRLNIDQPKTEAQWNETIQHLEAAVALVGERAPAEYYFQLGRAYAVRPDRRQQAINVFGQAIARDPAQKTYHWHLAAQHTSLGRYAEAHKALQAALKLDPNYGDAHALLATIALEQGRPADAERHYRDALKAMPASDSIHIGLGQAYYQLGRFEEAAAQLADVKQPSATSLFYQARAFAFLGRFDDAVACLSRRIEQFGDDAETRFYLGCARAHLETYPLALDDLNRTVALAPNHVDAWVQRGHVLLRMGDELMAYDSYQRALTIDGAHVEARYGLGHYEQERGRIKEAIEQYQRVAAVAPSHAPTQRALGYIHDKQGAFEEAIAAYTAALAIEDTHAWVHRRLGILYYSHAARYADTLRHLSRARELGDDSEHLQFYLALTFLRLGRYEQAAAEWEALAERHPNDPRVKMNHAAAYYYWGQQEFHAGRYCQAITCWERYQTHFSENRKIQTALAEAHFRLGVSQLQQNGQQTAEAIQTLRTAIDLQDNGAAPRYSYYLGIALLHGDGHVDTLDRAIHVFADVLKASEVHTSAQFYLGVCYWDRYLQTGDRGDLQQAIEKLRASASDTTGELAFVSRLALALAYACGGSWDHATKILVALWPELIRSEREYPIADIARLMTWGLVQTQGDAAAEQMLDRLRHAASHPALASCWGLLMVKRGRPDAAIAELETVMRQIQDDSTRAILRQMLCYKAALRGRESDWMGATEALQRAVNL